MSENSPRKAVVLLSGGLDSATCLAIAKEAGLELYALSFDYGQKQRVELEAAATLAANAGVASHRVLDLDLRGGSSLTTEETVPKHRSAAEIGDGIPSTYVPARNTVLLAHALAWAEVIGAYDIYIGVNAMDYSGYPDCRPEFISAFEALANQATGAAVEGRGHFSIRAPLQHLTKAEIIRLGKGLGVDYGLTHSCYDPIEGLACGGCDACLLRQQGFAAAELDDPTRYFEKRNPEKKNP